MVLTPVGLFNPSPFPQQVGIDWPDLNLTGALQVRDLWRQQTLGTFDQGYGAVVPAHGVVLLPYL